ncbi:hypothetical protein BGZ46_003504 [Entomortierella lignicola]|nr:hypothetical protein BGZ46_003504 [Entomortierella lignicola]
MKKHIEKKSCQEKTDDEVALRWTGFQEKIGNEVKCKPTGYEPAGLQDKNINEVSSIPSKRSLDKMVLTACGQLDGSDREKKKALLFMEGYELSLVSLTAKSGVNYFLLAHDSILGKLSTDSQVVVTVDPKLLFKNPEKNLCSRCSSLPSPGLEKLLQASPFAKLLLEMKFVELSKDVCKILNEDWVSKPYLKHVCARIFAGSILFNKTNNQAVIATGRDREPPRKIGNLGTPKS